MAAYTNLHSQLASIMEVLANAAVAEICQLVDDGFAGLRLEVSRFRRENLALKSRLRLMEVRAGGPRPHREPVPPLLITCSRTDHQFEEENDPAALKSTGLEKIPDQSKSAMPPNQEIQVVVEPADQEVQVRVEPEDQEVQVRAGPADQEVQVRVEPPNQEILLTAELVELEALEIKKEEEVLTSCRLLQEDETLGCIGAGRSLCVAENIRPLNAPLSTDGPPGGPGGLCPPPAGGRCAEDTVLPELLSGEKCADWSVKLEAQPSWPEVFGSHTAPPRVGGGCPGGADAKSLPGGGGAPQVDPGCLDSCSFDDLFSSPEVALSLAAPAHKHQPPAFPFPGGSGHSSTSGYASGSSECSSTERSFGCPQCSRLFSTSRDLLVHQRTHAGQRVYHCHLCRKPFLHPHQLKTHQRVHTGEKPFSCGQCGKRFSQSSHINRHMSVHTGEKRYCCGLCGKRFSQACSLKVHQAVHTGERPYSCTQCGKSFSVLGNLVRHQSVHVGK